MYSTYCRSFLFVVLPCCTSRRTPSTVRSMIYFSDILYHVPRTFLFWHRVVLVSCCRKHHRLDTAPTPCRSLTRLADNLATITTTTTTTQSCKPSPARSAAAVILATLLGGQGQPSDAPQEEGEENAGVEGIGGTSDAKAAVDASSENAAAAEQHDGGRSVGVQPWSPRLNEAGRRARFLEGDWHRESRDDPEWGLSEPPGEGSRGEGSRRRPQEQSVPNGVASPGGGLLGGSSGREGRSGTPASAGVVRRSPRQRSPRMRAATSANRREGQGQQEGKRSAVKGEKGLAVSWTRPLDAGGSCEGGVKGGEDRKMKKEESGGFGGVGGGGVLFAPEGLGPGSGSGDDYGGYSRKDKVSGEGKIAGRCDRPTQGRTRCFESWRRSFDRV